MRIRSIRTARLDLVAATLEHLDAELADSAALGRMLAARVPADWPPGQYDVDAIRFMRERLLAAGDEAAGWYGWYAVARGERAMDSVLVGAAGYFGPPAGDGTVEIGYSVSAEARRRGYATEIVRELVARAFAQPGVARVVAEARSDNVASYRVLERCGFTDVGPGREPGCRRWQLAPPWARGGPAETREAAVLVPFLRDASGGWRLVVVRRAQGGVHGGQLAFPGGTVAEQDGSLLRAALREAREEIGLPPEAVRVLAELPAVDTRVSNFRISPFLATLVDPPPWTPDPREIAEVLEAPLAALTAPAARRFASDLLPAGFAPVSLPYYPIGEHRLWGASERILHALLERLQAGEWPELRER